MGESNLNNNTFNNNIFNNSLMSNITSNESILIDDGHKLLFLGIIFILFILLIISIGIIIYLFKKKKKTNSVSNNKLVLNKIVLKNPNNNISLNIVNPKDFHELQNTSNVSDMGVQPPNNVLNEIKSQNNLQDEIHNIINSSINSLNSYDLTGKGEKKGGRRRLDKSGQNNNSNKNNKNSNSNKVEVNEKPINNKKEINTQELEKEIKNQIKKYVIEENNI